MGTIRHSPPSESPNNELLAKILALPPERVAEVEDFVDFIRSREEEQALVASAERLAQPAFEAVWDNPDDSEYDRL